MNETTGNTPPEVKPLDAEIYDKISDLSLETYEYLAPDKDSVETSKAKFMAGEIDLPELSYSKLNVGDLRQRELKLLELKDSLKLDDKDRLLPIAEKSEEELVKQVYHWRINELIADVRMLLAAAEGDMHRFNRYNKFVYGGPKPEILNYIIEYTKGMIKTAKESGGDLAESASELENLLPKVVEIGDKKVVEPNQELVSEASEITKNQVADMIDFEIPETLNAEQIADGFRQALDKLKAEGWVVRIEADNIRKTISVSQENKEVVVPSGRTMIRDRFYEIAAHEIGTHVQRRENGVRSKLKLLGIGIDRYEPGEEGVALMREQSLGRDVGAFAGHTYTLGISAALGVGSEAKDFRQVYELIQKYNCFIRLKGGATKEDAEKKSSDFAWNSAIRLFKGTTGKAGSCYTKDLVYLEGNIGAWDVLDKKFGEIHRFCVGKYNPGDPRHVAVLDRLGISDEDLKEYEEIW